MWDLPIRLIEQDIQDMIEIMKLFNPAGEEESHATDQDVIDEAAKFHLKPPIKREVNDSSRGRS